MYELFINLYIVCCLQDIKYQARVTAEFFEVAAANFILEPGALLTSKGRGHVDGGQGFGQHIGAGAGHASRGGNGRS